MELSNPELEKEINQFFEEANEKLDKIFNELGFDIKEVCPADSEEFLRQRDELLKNFEKHLFASCSVLKDLEKEDLSEVLNEKIDKLISEEGDIEKHLKELSTEKENLRGQLDVKSTLIKEGMEKKKEIERICNESVKEEFVRLCKFMNLKFQWCQTDQKFTIVFLSDSSDVNQVKQINAKKLLDNDEKYVKQLRDHFKVKVLQFIK